jgi:hypothetical protein
MKNETTYFIMTDRTVNGTILAECGSNLRYARDRLNFYRNHPNWGTIVKNAVIEKTVTTRKFVK